MSETRVSSSPDLIPLSNTIPEDLSLEGIATNVKLLLKLVQDHQEASHKGSIDERQVQRLAGMMTILDDVKTRLQKSSTSGKKSRAELRRCNTDLRANNPPRDSQKKNEPLILDEKERLKRDLNASYAAHKRLGVMCASLGREKDIISRELTRKVQELSEMEELVGDLRKQNERLSAKIQACVAEHKEGMTGGDVSEMVNLNCAVLQERNKELSEQLVKSLEGYKSMKRRVREGQGKMEGMVTTMEEVGEEIKVGIRQTQNLKQHIIACGLGEQMGEMEEITALEDVFKRFKTKVLRFKKENNEC